MHEYGTEPNTRRLVWRRAHSTLRCCLVNIEQKTRLPRYNSRKATTSIQTKIKYKTSSVYVLVWRYKEGTRLCTHIRMGILSAESVQFFFLLNLTYGFRFDPIRCEGEHFNRPANERFVDMRVVCIWMQLCHENFTQNETQFDVTSPRREEFHIFKATRRARETGIHKLALVAAFRENYCAVIQVYLGIVERTHVLLICGNAKREPCALLQRDSRNSFIAIMTKRTHINQFSEFNVQIDQRYKGERYVYIATHSRLYAAVYASI